MNLTPAAEAAWMIAAGEAAASGHAQIAPAHLLIGVLSLEKIGPGDQAKGGAIDASLVREECARLSGAIAPLALDVARLRRRTRARLGRGPGEGPPAGPLSRSLACKALFAAAGAFAGAARPVGAAHLLAALAEGVDNLTLELVRASGVAPGALRDAALSAAADPGLDERLDTLEAALLSRLVGQDVAAARIAGLLRDAFSGEAASPAAVLVFAGPRGCGKALAASVVAEHLFGPAGGLVRADSRELADPAAVSRLTAAATAAPRVLALLNRVEEADPRAVEVLERILGEGRLSDPSGVVEARPLVVVLTVTTGPEASDPLGFLVSMAAGPELPPGLASAVHDTVTFRALDENDVAAVVERALGALTAAVERQHGVRVRVTPEAARFAAGNAVASGLGASAASAVAEKLVQGPLAALVLTGKLTRHPAWVAVYDEGGVYLLPEA